MAYTPATLDTSGFPVSHLSTMRSCKKHTTKMKNMYNGGQINCGAVRIAEDFHSPAQMNSAPRRKEGANPNTFRRSNLAEAGDLAQPAFKEFPLRQTPCKPQRPAV